MPSLRRRIAPLTDFLAAAQVDNHETLGRHALEQLNAMRRLAVVVCALAITVGKAAGQTGPPHRFTLEPNVGVGTFSADISTALLYGARALWNWSAAGAVYIEYLRGTPREHPSEDCMNEFCRQLTGKLILKQWQTGVEWRLGVKPTDGLALSLGLGAGKLLRTWPERAEGVPRSTSSDLSTNLSLALARRLFGGLDAELRAGNYVAFVPSESWFTPGLEWMGTVMLGARIYF